MLWAERKAKSMGVEWRGEERRGGGEHFSQNNKWDKTKEGSLLIESQIAGW